VRQARAIVRRLLPVLAGVVAMALAAAAAGADGVLIDVHTEASNAKCDGDQALSAVDFHGLMDRLRLILPGLGRSCPARK